MDLASTQTLPPTLLLLLLPWVDMGEPDIVTKALLSVDSALTGVDSPVRLVGPQVKNKAWLVDSQEPCAEGCGVKDEGTFFQLSVHL